MKKRPHKVLGIEMRPDNMIRNSDPLGKVDRVSLDYSALSAPQQGQLDGFAKRVLGQSA